jgi:hypothetical protein
MVGRYLGIVGRYLGMEGRYLGMVGRYLDMEGRYLGWSGSLVQEPILHTIVSYIGTTPLENNNVFF